MAFPEPQGGLVISYSYLWRRESEAGQIEGVKNRPCTIVLAIRREGPEAAAIVTVAPITHSAPRDASVAMEIPPKVKRHLGLDSERSWTNSRGPGFDLRPVPGQPGCYEYGFPPPTFYRKIIERILELRRERRVFVSAREE
jgi:hypothetical protein